MELMKLPYHDVIFMPVKRFYDLIKWKSDLEDERQKMIKVEEDKIRSGSSRKK